MIKKLKGTRLDIYKRLWKKYTSFPWVFTLYTDNRKCNTNTGILGYYDIKKPYNIYIADFYDERQMLPTLVHEYIHMQQYQKYGLLLYSLLAFPLWRKWTLEKTARKAEYETYKKLDEDNWL